MRQPAARRTGEAAAQTQRAPQAIGALEQREQRAVGQEQAVAGGTRQHPRDRCEQIGIGRGADQPRRQQAGGDRAQQQQRGRLPGPVPARDHEQRREQDRIADQRGEQTQRHPRAEREDPAEQVRDQQHAQRRREHRDPEHRDPEQQLGERARAVPHGVAASSSAFSRRDSATKLFWRGNAITKWRRTTAGKRLSIGLNFAGCSTRKNMPRSRLARSAPNNARSTA